MKKTLIILFLLTAFVFAKAQYPIQQSVANAPNTIGRTNAFRANDGFVNGVFSDTTAANLKQIKAYPGAQIFTTLDSSFWLRNPPATRWLKANAAAGSISSFTFITDSSLVICYADGSCDTIPINNFTETVNNIVQNFLDSSIFNLNDSTIIICNGQGVCDTFNLNNSNTYSFFVSGDTTYLVTCDTLQAICVGDSCYSQQVCDTIALNRPLAAPVYQNLLRTLPGAPNIIEGGSAQGDFRGSLAHDTYYYLGGYTLNIEGAAGGKPPFTLRNYQQSQISSSIMSYNHIGSPPNGWNLPDENNPVKLYVNYHDPIYIPTAGALQGDTVGFFGNKYGYSLMTNSRGTTYYYEIDDMNAKQVGIFFPTYGNDNDGVTIFGNKLPSTYVLPGPTPTDSTLLDARIANFKTTGQVQFPKYLTINSFPGTAEGLIGFDASGNLITTTGVAGSTTTIINDSTIEVCTGSVCDTIIFSDVDAQNVFVINDSTLLVCNVTNTVCDTVNIPQGFAFFDRGFFDPNQASIGATVHNANSNDFSLVSADEILLGANTRTYIQGRLEEDMGVSVAAANNLTLGSDGNLFTITGATQINAITTANWQAGSKVWFIFSGAPLVKNATAGGAGTVTILLAGRVDFQAAAGDILYLGYNGTNWYEINRVLASGAPVTNIIAMNGLWEDPSNTISLGSNTPGDAVFSNDRYIYVGAHDFQIYTDDNGVPLILNNLTSGDALSSFSTGGVAGRFQSGNSTTNTILDVVTVNRSSNSTPAAGMGGAIGFQLETSDLVNNVISNRLISKWVDPLNATRTSQLDITGVNSASTTTIMSAYGSGVVGIGISSSYTASRLDVVDNAATGQIARITSTSTAATGNAQRGLYVELSGANANANQTTAAIHGLNTHTGSNAINFGVVGTTSSTAGGLSAGVSGTNSSTGWGVYGGTNGSGTAIEAQGPTTGIGVQGSASTSGIGVRGNTSTGQGIFGSASGSGGVPLYGLGDPPTTNDATPMLTLNRRGTGGAGADGIGGYMQFLLYTTTTSDVLSNRITSTFTTATHASRTSTLNIQGVLAATTVDLLTLAGDGSVKLRPITATAASAITPAEGMLVFVSDTNGTFVSIGIWCYQNSAWKAL